ncbi:hypothetical protein AVEN_2723-1 [Araneus ventricosus]|uniref:Uncharacterized protein n=1 Tax=Araneus ventricosus TaxID=182803 RepID=A0A4Y2K9K7_ARAVE|nr:hypothetical protein AVEN_2723-1 [Araneus ventricosus]
MSTSWSSILIHIVTKIFLCVYGEDSPTSRIMENMFIHNYSGKDEAQVTGIIALIQISNAHYNNSNSTFIFSNTDSQNITNNDSSSTFNSAQLSGFQARTADETPNLFLLSVASVYIPLLDWS